MRTSFEGIGPEEVDTVEEVDPAGPGVVRLVVDNAELAPPALNDDEIRHGGGPPPVEGELLCHYLDPRRRLRSIRDKDHGRLQILGLLGEQNTILEEYPQFQRETKIGKRSSGGGREVEEWAITGWKPDEVARALIAECAKKGTFDPLERVRGLGAWLSPAGDLVLHVGDAVLVGRRWRRPGVIEGFVYSADKQLPRPAEIMTLGGSTGPAADLLQTLRTWNWKRPELDPYLLLGWTGAAKIGGALRWRPGVYLTGDTGTGKSTLIDEILRPIFGPEGAVIVSDATASGIAQRLKFATLPVIADELEATSNPQARDAIMELRRAAASGALRLRGSADQEAHGQQLRFCSLFSAILPVAISPQDENRSTSLELIGPPTGKPPHCEPVKMDAVARALTRQLVDYWVNQLDPSAGEQMTEGQHCLAHLLQTPLHLVDWPKVERAGVPPSSSGCRCSSSRISRPGAHPALPRHWRC